MNAPPEGWQEALDTWMRIWRGACRELERNAWSARATLVERTAYRRLTDLMAQRGMLGVVRWAL